MVISNFIKFVRVIEYLDKIEYSTNSEYKKFQLVKKYINRAKLNNKVYENNIIEIRISWFLVINVQYINNMFIYEVC